MFCAGLLRGLERRCGSPTFRGVLLVSKMRKQFQANFEVSSLRSADHAHAESNHYADFSQHLSGFQEFRTYCTIQWFANSCVPSTRQLVEVAYERAASGKQKLMIAMSLPTFVNALAIHAPAGGFF